MATKNQIRDFSSMMLNCVDEKTLEKIDANELKKIIDNPKQFIKNFVQWINGGISIEEIVFLGSLKRVVSNLFLEHNKNFVLSHSFLPKEDGGFFGDVDPCVFDESFGEFDNIIESSPSKNLGVYELTERISKKDIIKDTQELGIYEEVNFAHIFEVYSKHYSKSKKTLTKKAPNIFWVRNKVGDLRTVQFLPGSEGWIVDVDPNDEIEYSAGSRIFLRNNKIIDSPD